MKEILKLNLKKETKSFRDYTISIPSRFNYISMIRPLNVRIIKRYGEWIFKPTFFNALVSIICKDEIEIIYKELIRLNKEK